MTNNNPGEYCTQQPGWSLVLYPTHGWEPPFFIGAMIEPIKRALYAGTVLIVIAFPTAGEPLHVGISPIR
jgi:hypothetical protein